MPQRCSYCGKTEKQHKGKACIDIPGFKKVLAELAELTHTPAPKTRKKILRNRVQCSSCLEFIESLHRHDFKMCSCGAVGVDGGREYLKRVFSYNHPFIELSEEEDIEVAPKETQAS